MIAALVRYQRGISYMVINEVGLRVLDGATGDDDDDDAAELWLSSICFIVVACRNWAHNVWLFWAPRATFVSYQFHCCCFPNYITTHFRVPLHFWFLSLPLHLASLSSLYCPDGHVASSTTTMARTNQNPSHRRHCHHSLALFKHYSLGQTCSSNIVPASWIELRRQQQQQQSLHQGKWIAKSEVICPFIQVVYSNRRTKSIWFANIIQTSLFDLAKIYAGSSYGYQHEDITTTIRPLVSFEWNNSSPSKSRRPFPLITTLTITTWPKHYLHIIISLPYKKKLAKAIVETRPDHRPEDLQR